MITQHTHIRLPFSSSLLRTNGCRSYGRLVAIKGIHIVNQYIASMLE